MSKSRKEIFEDIRNLFENKELLSQALTHSSWVNENQGVREHNERLEFLGNAVLGFIIADFLFRKYTDKREGSLTIMKNNIENNSTLAKIAGHLGIEEALHFGEGERIWGGKKKEKIQAGALEALIGALWLDQGFERVQDFVNEYILSHQSDVGETPPMETLPKKHVKNFLSEYCQKTGKPLPNYQVISEEGPDHLSGLLLKSLSKEYLMVRARGPQN